MSLNNPEYVKVNGRKYKINTDFRVAIKCNHIAEDDNISDYKRPYIILYLLFGEEALKNSDDYNKLLALAKRYLSLDKEPNNNSNDITPDMDFEEDMDYIETSFMSDYRIDLSKEKMHWWKFYKLVEGLSDSELGNCCVLNRIRNLRRINLSEIKDDKERQRIAEAQKQVSLKKYNREFKLTKAQEESMNKLNEIIGLKE